MIFRGMAKYLFPRRGTAKSRQLAAAGGGALEPRAPRQVAHEAGRQRHGRRRRRGRSRLRLEGASGGTGRGHAGYLTMPDNEASFPQPPPQGSLQVSVPPAS